MIEFYTNDYGLTCVPEVLNALKQAEGTAYNGYGLDTASQRAADLMREQCGTPDAEVLFLPGGTGTNVFFINSALKPFEAVIAPDSGHINVHETGAVEAGGNKILTVRTGPDGKITEEHFTEIRRIVGFHADEHMVRPAMLYISQTTERGGVYSLRELESLRELADELGLLLFIDGARLAVALTAPSADASLRDIARLSDAFYFGGTKAGLLYGEALLIKNKALHEDLRFYLKRKLQMMAKGFNLGIQFESFFENKLYLKVGDHANQAAQNLATSLAKHDYAFASETVSNQIFVTVSPEEGTRLQEAFGTELTGSNPDGSEVRRFVTSWLSPLDTDAMLNSYLNYREKGER